MLFLFVVGWFFLVVGGGVRVQLVLFLLLCLFCFVLFFVVGLWLRFLRGFQIFLFV